MAKRLQELIKKREAVNARIKKEQARTRTSERKKDTHRKVLAGAAVLQWATKDTAFAQRLMEEMGRFIVRDADRALFGLPPVQKKPGGKSPSS